MSLTMELIARWVVTGIHLSALSVASLYGLHRFWLVWRCWRTRGQRAQPARPFEEAPRVTIQLPLFNESTVAERIIEAACAIDWPRDRLQVQVLDDSTDECAEQSRAVVARLRKTGHDVVWIHRTDRTGFKAGALQNGLATATGDFIAIFDADFVPPRSFLRDTIDYFGDDGIGMVQTAWDHLNADSSMLTRAQAVWLDSHFQIEHTARDRDGCWFNFNGTAGVWRRGAIESSGGWQHETLTEDMDLSYRAQLVGWRFRYLPDVLCPAELPPTLAAFKTQQHRWTKGTVQTGRKLLGTILRSGAAWRCKREAFMHMTSPIVYPCVILIAVLMYPAIVLNLHVLERGGVASIVVGLAILLLATASGCTFYAAGQRVRGVSWWRTVARLPGAVALGIGMSVNGTVAAAEAMLGHESPFVRTPKAGDGALPPGTITSVAITSGAARRWSLIAVELGLGVYILVCACLAAFGGVAAATPFLLLFAVGYLAIGLLGATARDRGTDVPEAAVVDATPVTVAVGGHG